mmetsp:Transcript_38842/g.79199  ORF Transcript_38842/g.79199 Transcript_38842/m.79199 type:complete len:119 (+) Transcript_38842:620-976(+)
MERLDPTGGSPAAAADLCAATRLGARGAPTAEVANATICAGCAAIHTGPASGVAIPATGCPRAAAGAPTDIPAGDAAGKDANAWAQGGAATQRTLMTKFSDLLLTVTGLTTEIAILGG